MTELQIYGKDGLFHQIVKQSAIMNGRYAILPKGGPELNRNNLLSGLDLPKDKYPGVFCLPPISDIEDSLAKWEFFIFRLLFLCTTNYTGDNKIKTPDFNTNSSLHTADMDWSDMKTIALSFMHALEKVQRQLTGKFFIKQGDRYKIFRVTEMQNDNLSGVLLTFTGSLASPCVFTDINVGGIDVILTEHFH